MDNLAFRWIHTHNGVVSRYGFERQVKQPFDCQRYNLVACYQDGWNVASVIIAGLTQSQYEHRVSKIIESADCEVV